MPLRPLPPDLPRMPAPGRSHGGTPGALAQVSTAGVAADERIDFWHHAHLGRMHLSRPDGGLRAFEGRVRRIMGNHTHVVEHESTALQALRSERQCRHDGVDYVSLNFMLSSREAHMAHRGTHRLDPGAMYFVDSARPVQFRHLHAHSLSIFLPRALIQDAVGDLDHAPVLLPTGGGIVPVLQAHMRMVALEAGRMTPDQRVCAVWTCESLALAALQSARGTLGRHPEKTGGLLEAARALIEQQCTDPQLNPDAVAVALGCSRATLYRLFDGQAQSVSTAIWQARLRRARSLLASGLLAGRSLAEVAFLSGFTDQAGFNRMFRRCYGMTPGEARERDAAARTEGDLGLGS